MVAGAFSPDTLARDTLSTSYPHSTHVTIFLLDPSHKVLFSSGPLAAQDISADHPGVTDALRGKSGTTYVKQYGVEHVVAYSSITPTGWALVTDSARRDVRNPLTKTPRNILATVMNMTINMWALIRI
jgi:hypothetical protein